MDALFEHAPPIRIQQRFGLVKPDNLNIKRRVLLFVLVVWGPLVLLALLQSVVLGTDDLMSLLGHVRTHAAYLVTGPLLIFAESVCAPRLSAVVRHCAGSDIIAESGRGRFDDAIRSTRRLLESPGAEIGAITLAYVTVLMALLSTPPEQLPDWGTVDGGASTYSPVGWWNIAVSLPLLLILIIGWIWRVALWTRLLWLISRLDLVLVASHPDRCAGLSFLGRSVGAFWIVALAFGVMVAGESVQVELETGELARVLVYVDVVLVLMIVAMFAAPMLVFTPMLTRTWRRGTFEYGALAQRLGQSFERKWLDSDAALDEGALCQPDFSATADLYAVVSNVHAIHLVPIGLKDLSALVLATSLPFVPVLLLAAPVTVIWMHIKGLLL
ncbi:MAG TPA: hypothetical protein VF329_00910 [Gammaproteobacteria bacterium]